MKLQVKVPLLVTMILFAICIISSGTIIYFQRKASINQFEEMAIALAGTVQGSLEHSMLTGESRQSQEVMVHIREEEMKSW